MITNEYGISEIQTNLLHLVKKIDELCKNHNIQYTLLGGTLLGAIREKGFIPWDDDIDIGMTREQYKKFAQLFSGEKNGEMYLDDKKDKIKKIWLKQNQYNVWVDIFIYDFISEKKIPQKLKITGLKFLTAFSKSKETMEAFRVNGRAKGFLKRIYEAIYAVSRPIPLEFRIKIFDKFCEYAFVGGGKFIHRANDQLWAMPMIIPAEYMNEFTYVCFEDTELMIATHYETILTQLYGNDYMTPKKVTEKEQKVHDLARKNA